VIQERRPGTARSKAEPSCDPIETVGRPETGAQTLIGSAGEVWKVLFSAGQRKQGSTRPAGGNGGPEGERGYGK